MQPIFADRIDAGKRIAKILAEHYVAESIILAIPMGGIPVAASAAKRLKIPWNILISKKLPIPWNPEAGFGAIADDGSVVLNDSIIHGLHLSSDLIEAASVKVKGDIDLQKQLFEREKPLPDISGKCAIVIDDGLASGFTMLAAIKSLRKKRVSKIIAASPVASRSAAGMIEKAADECCFEIISAAVPFYVSNFYLKWTSVSIDEALMIIKQTD